MNTALCISAALQTTIYLILSRRIYPRMRFNGNNFYDIMNFTGRGDLLQIGLMILLPTDHPVIPTARGSVEMNVGDYVMLDEYGPMRVYRPILARFRAAARAWQIVLTTRQSGNAPNPPRSCPAPENRSPDRQP